MATNYSSSDFHLGAWLVYINGLEIPVENVSTSFGVWQVPTATLTVTPHRLLRRLGAEDRIQVVVFYLDYHWDEQPTLRLMGEYEIVGISYQNNPRGRSMQLNCLGQAAIFRQLQFFYISSVDDMVQALSAVGNSDASYFTEPKVLYPASLFYEGLTKPDGNSVGNPIKRPIEFVLNVFRALLSEISTSNTDVPEVVAGDNNSISNFEVKLPKTAASVPGRNFFGRWLLMTGFYKRWAGFPGIDDSPSNYDNGGCFPLIKAAQEMKILEVLQTRVGESVGNSGSAWDLLQAVLGYMYMEVLAVPAPPAVQLNKDTHMADGLVGAKADANTTIASHYVKPSLYFALPPVCNVFFPSQITDWGYSENYNGQPTRLYLNENSVTKTILFGESDEAASSAALISAVLVTGYPVPVRKRMKQLLTGGVESSKNMLLFPEEFFIGPTSAQASAPEWMFVLAQDLKSTGNVESPQTSDGPLSQIFEDYAQYEYYRRRYCERSGTVNMAFNPYVLPGFPGVIFDKDESGMDIFMYITGVSHNLNAQGSMTTTVSFSFSRSLEEFAGVTGATTAQVQADSAQGGGGGRLITMTIPPTKTAGKQGEAAKAATKAPKPGKKTIIRGKGKKLEWPGNDWASWTQEQKDTWNTLCRADRPGALPMNPATINIIETVAQGFPGKAINIVSGYRFAATENTKGYYENGAPKGGLHSGAIALDFKVEGVSQEELWLFCLDAFPTGHGVGYYPYGGGSTHVDIRGANNGKMSARTQRWVHLDPPNVAHTEAMNDTDNLEMWKKQAEAGLKPTSVSTGTGGDPETAAVRQVIEDSGDNDADFTGVSNTPTSEPQEYQVRIPIKKADMYPIEVIPDITLAFQYLTAAQTNYAKFLYGDANSTKPAVFNWRELLIASDDSGKDIELTGDLSKLTNNSFLKATAKLAPLYENYEMAMRFAARPACSLQDYISIWHGGDAAKAESVRGAKEMRFYSEAGDSKGSQGAVYWSRIYKLLQGPGNTPDPAYSNVGPAEEYPPVKEFKKAGPETGMAQTRDNWDDRLEQYRKIVLSVAGYKYPQG
jgi:hypothetical protein